MAHPHESHESHETHEAPPAPAQHHTVEEAAHELLAGLSVMRPRLTHAYGCPAEHAGHCTCGYELVVSGTGELVDALKALPPPPEGTRRH
jgi:hypothetical protein